MRRQANCQAKAHYCGRGKYGVCGARMIRLDQDDDDGIVVHSQLQSTLHRLCRYGHTITLLNQFRVDKLLHPQMIDSIRVSHGHE